MKPEPTRRLFFALWPDEAMQTALFESTGPIIESLGAHSGHRSQRSAAQPGEPQSSQRRPAPAAQRVPASNLHLTLAFLGAVPQSRMELLSTTAAQLASTFTLHAAAQIEITLDRIEHWRKPQILCATASTTPPIAGQLAASLKRALQLQGFAPDLKPFQTHATIARKVRRLTGAPHLSPVRWAFSDFRLIESRTDPTGPIYSIREIYPLDEPVR